MDDAPTIDSRPLTVDLRPSTPHAHPSISVIIPTLNEESTIGRTLEQLQSSSVREVIVVDGRSEDGTTRIARRHGARVVEAPPSRGRQQDVGAAAASGEVFLFLHADTELPDGFDRQVHRVLGRPGVAAGAFRLRINSNGWSYRGLEFMIDLRSRLLQLPYGDQAIFLKAEVFRRIGGFPHFAVMEDFALVQRLRRVGRIAMADTAVRTSARRWLKNGLWRTTLLNQACLAAYCAGVSVDRIARWRVRRSPQRRC